MTNSTNAALELHNGKAIGRDPRTLTPSELQDLGHRLRSPLKAIAAACLDCCAFQQAEVRKCVSHGCPLWPFRMGTNPHDRRTLSDEQRTAAAERMTLARSR